MNLIFKYSLIFIIICLIILIIKIQYLNLINYIGYEINFLENNFNYNKFKLIKNKNKTKQFLINNGFPTTKTIKLNNINNFKYNTDIVIKPIDGKSGKDIKFDKIQNINKYNLNNMLIEEFLYGSNYRIVCYKNKVISVFHRIKPYVIGDGINNIENLIINENKKRNNNNKIININKNLFNFIPNKNTKFILSNLCTYGMGGKLNIIPLNKVNKHNIKMFESLSKKINLNLFSIDYITTDISKPYYNINNGINELEFCNDYSIHFILKDNTYFLIQYLISKQLFFIFSLLFLFKIK